MDADDVRYMCPRPRASRACVSCKAHKTRCLPSAHSNHCQRCQKTGTMCSFSDAQSSRRNNRLAQRSKHPTPQSVMTGSALDSILNRIPPAALDVQYEDESETVVQLHGKLFGDNERCGLEKSPAADRQSVDTGRKSEKGDCPGRPCVTMNQVDQMLQSFHTQNACFPFVTVAKNTTAEALREKCPFLLMSILVVSSAADPMLQKFLDEQFRKVLATRVVMQGEKSLDYLQGLLIYLAWHPTHLRPVNNQISQYMQLAIGMVSDLNLESRMESTIDSAEDQISARNTTLGCYVQSLSVTMGLKQPRNFTFSPSKELLNSMLTKGNDPTTHTIASIVLLCKFIEKMHSCDLEKEMRNSPGIAGCPLQNITQAYLEELRQIESDFPAHVNTNNKVHIMQRFARIKLHALALGQESPLFRGQQTVPSHHHLHQASAHSYLQIFSTCFTEINSLIEFFTNASAADCKKLTFSEWAMLIQTIALFPKLQKFTITTDRSTSTFWQSLIDTERVDYIGRLERLRDHLEDISATKPDTQSNSNRNNKSRNPPDLFYLFTTVLKLFKENFERESMHSLPIQLSSGPSGHQSKSQCPVMNGDLQDTEYWDLLTHSNNYNFNTNFLDTVDSFDAGTVANFDINDPLYFDLGSWIDFSV